MFVLYLILNHTAMGRGSSASCVCRRMSHKTNHAHDLICGGPVPGSGGPVPGMRTRMAHRCCWCRRCWATKIPRRRRGISGPMRRTMTRRWTMCGIECAWARGVAPERPMYGRRYGDQVSSAPWHPPGCHAGWCGCPARACLPICYTGYGRGRMPRLQQEDHRQQDARSNPIHRGGYAHSSFLPHARHALVAVDTAE